MSFNYPRQIRFHETDGAGVVYFANVLTLCHEAYEASLAAAGIDLADFFSPQGNVVPIVHASVDFFRPMVCGDRIHISLTPKPVARADYPLSRFEISYRLLASAPRHAEAGNASQAEPQNEREQKNPVPRNRDLEKPDPDSQAIIIAQAQTRHCCIDAATRRRRTLPDDLLAWLAQWQTEP